MFKQAILLGSVLLGAIAFTAPVVCPQAAFAGQGKHKKAKLEHHGKVAAVDTTANTVTLHNKKKGDMTFTVASGTPITIDGTAGKALTDVTTEMNAKVKSADGKAADSIEAKSHKKKK